MIIHKAKLHFVDAQQLALPYAAKILSVQSQRGEICLWYEFDDNLNVGDIKQRMFYIVGTGNQYKIPDKTFIGTVQIEQYVWHIFEGGKQ